MVSVLSSGWRCRVNICLYWPVSFFGFLLYWLVTVRISAGKFFKSLMLNHIYMKYGVMRLSLFSPEHSLNPVIQKFFLGAALLALVGHSGVSMAQDNTPVPVLQGAEEQIRALEPEEALAAPQAAPPTPAVAPSPGIPALDAAMEEPSSVPAPVKNSYTAAAAQSGVAPEADEPVPLFDEPDAAPGQAASDLPPPPPGVEDDIFGIEEQFDFEKSPQQLEEEVRTQAFDAALQGLLPLRPEEIRILLERYDRTQESVEVPIYPTAKPELVVETVPMDPGTVPLTIKTAVGQVTTLNFIDITGERWPIQQITWAGDFDIVESTGGEASNMLRITPNSAYARGNISIQMLKLDTPIVMILETDRDVVHYRFDAIVPEKGPFAQAPLIEKGMTLAAGNKDASSMLQGMVPDEAEKMNVQGVDGRTSAYNYNGMTYLRTPLTLLSPAWSSSVSSADGMRVYEIQATPVVLLSDGGKMVRAHISPRETITNEQ